MIRIARRTNGYPFVRWFRVSGRCDKWHIPWCICDEERKHKLFQNLEHFLRLSEISLWRREMSIAYLRKTFSICFDWKRPLIINCWLPSIEPLVPNSASKKSNKCFGCLSWAWEERIIFELFSPAITFISDLVIWFHLPVQCFANICEIGKRRLFRADT